jgi:protein tyrosine phosphatase (PTP) superfamily phosphohydrolase (DUF442 family)
MPGRSALAGLVVVALAALVALPGPVRTYLLEENLHPVVPGKIYRSAQPSASELEAMIDELGLRSILNLRGERGGREWLEAEQEVAARRGVEHHSVRLNADRMPPSQRLREVVRVLDEAPRPLLFHCQGGVERSGLVGALAVLLTGGDLDAARREFAASKGFVGFLARTDLPLVLDDYERWLAGRGEPHDPERLRHWIDEEYAPYFYRARIEPVDPPAELRVGEPATLRFRVTNTSTRTIPFRESRRRGVHLGALLEPGPEAEASASQLRSGFVDLDLAPGQATELELPLPPLAEAGRWSMRVDLVDEHVKWFGDMGSEPIELAVEVRADAG